MADLYYNKVALLLPMSGPDEGSTFTDWSQSPKTVTRYGNAHTETDQYKFYDSSGYFDGAGDYLSLSDSNDFYFDGDFCIEAWFRLNALPEEGNGANSIKMIYAQRASDTVRIFFGISYWQGSQTSPGFWLKIDNSSDVISLFGSPVSAMQVNTWYHCAATISSGTARIFLDGNLLNSASISGTVPNVSASLIIGTGWNDFFNFHGYMQDLRITKGFARYTDTFTPPSRFIGNISGAIYDKNGDPAARKIVAWPRVIHPPTTAITYTTTSSAVDGSYTLGPMPDAEYTRIVLADETTLVNDIVDRVFPG